LNQASSRKRDISQLFRTALTHLFVQEKDPNSIYLFLGIITLIGAVLRIFVINSPIGYDEAYTFIYFASKPFKFILADYHAPNNHILNSFLIGIAYRVFGNHTWIVRLPAFVAGVLGIPAAYFTARRFFTREQALAASAILAVSPSLISDATNGRGYTLVALFSLFLVNFAGILVAQQSRTALIAYAITGALGFYTIPIFLYPMAGISLWVAITYLTENDSWKNKLAKLGIFLGTCIASGILTLILYSPVIIFGTGFQSIVGNDIVKPLTWFKFTENFNHRIAQTWDRWMLLLNPAIQYLLAGGFIISTLLYRKVSNQRIPMQLTLVLAVIILVILQRLTPLPRIWSYLEMFYLFFSAVGLIWLVQTIVHKFADHPTAEKILSTALLLIVIFISANTLVKAQSKEATADHTVIPEQFAAEYLTEHLTPNDTILSIAPVDMRTAYYLKINGISYDVFYQRDHPVEIQNALVLVRKTESYDTLQSVLRFFKLTQSLDMKSAEVVFEYGPLQVYSVPAK
jgi:4-amino-4-deoxy-L-arabinose transferase-like glycosyltransferase